MNYSSRIALHFLLLFVLVTTVVVISGIIFPSWPTWTGGIIGVFIGLFLCVIDPFKVM